MLIIQGLLYYGNYPIIREIAVLFYNTTFPKGSYTLLFHYWFFLYSLFVYSIFTRFQLSISSL